MEHPGARILASLSFRSELQHGANFGEGWRRPHHGDEGGLLVEVLAETDHDDVDELRVADMIAEFTEFISYGFDALTEQTDWSIALRHVAELGVQHVLPGIAVALEQLAQGGPDFGDGGAV